MKKGKLIAVIISIVVLILAAAVITYFAVKNKTNVKVAGECSADSDCIPASCCHPTECTSKENAPLCKSIMCTQVCASNTLDCGQGSCKCVNNKCNAVMK